MSDAVDTAAHAGLVRCAVQVTALDAVLDVVGDAALLWLPLDERLVLAVARWRVGVYGGGKDGGAAVACAAVDGASLCRSGRGAGHDESECRHWRTSGGWTRSETDGVLEHEVVRVDEACASEVTHRAFLHTRCVLHSSRNEG